MQEKLREIRLKTSRKMTQRSLPVSSRRTVYEIVRRRVERRTLAMKIDACNAKRETCYSGRTECVEVGGRGRS